MRRRLLARLGVLVLVSVAVASSGGCTRAGDRSGTPGLASRGTTMTTAKPTRQDLTNRVSLSGKVTMNAVFGLVAPVAGQVRYLDVRPPQGTPTKPTRVAGVWAGGKATYVEVPAGSVFSGRLVDDRSTVTAGMPVVSAKHVGYAVVADIDGGQAYRISDAAATVQAQIKNGPGPFPCTILGAIAALPAGTVPEPSQAPSASAGTGDGASAPPAAQPIRPGAGEGTGSDPTGLRLVCTGPPDVKMINGATVTLEVVTERATNALVLPVEAVAGGQGKGKVDVVRPDGTRQTRDVVLGLSDGKVIEIRSGLTGDETVAVPGPDIPQRPAGGKDGSAAPMDGPVMVK